MSQIFLKIWTFRCAQCRKIKDAPFGATMDTWSPALKRGGKFFCSLACARAWDKANGKEHHPERYATSGNVYTPEDDEKIISLRDSGLTWDEIGRRLGRSGAAVQNRYSNALAWQGRPIGQSAG